MLEDKVYVFDNLVPTSYQDYVEHLFLSGNHIPFYLSPGTTTNLLLENYNEKFRKNLFDDSQMQHFFVTNKKIQSQFYQNISPLFNYVHSFFNHKFHYSVLRLKSNLKHKISQDFKNKFNPPHVDIIPPLPNTWVFLYYVVDSDGDTIIYNETHTGVSYPSNFSIKQKITPKKGRILIFPANYFHSANFCTFYNIRLVINGVIQIYPIE